MGRDEDRILRGRVGAVVEEHDSLRLEGKLLDEFSVPGLGLSRCSGSGRLAGCCEVVSLWVFSWLVVVVAVVFGG